MSSAATTSARLHEFDQPRGGVGQVSNGGCRQDNLARLFLSFHTPSLLAAPPSPRTRGPAGRVRTVNTASPQTTRRWAIDPDQAFGVQALRERLIGRAFAPGLWGWIVPLAVTVLAGMLRFTNLNHPHLLIFDETYYVKDAYTMMHAGYELEWGENPNDAFINGHPEPKDTASFVVHPPLGKWLIAGGMWLFGTDNGLGWRFSAALFGTLVGAAGRVGRPETVFLGAPGRAGRRAGRHRRAPDRHVPHRAAGHLPDVLHPRRILGAAQRPLPRPRETRQGPGHRRRETARSAAAGLRPLDPVAALAAAGRRDARLRRRREMVGAVLHRGLRPDDGAVGPVGTPPRGHQALDPRRGAARRNPRVLHHHPHGHAPCTWRPGPGGLPRRAAATGSGRWRTRRTPGPGSRPRCVRWPSTTAPPTPSTRA